MKTLLLLALACALTGCASAPDADLDWSGLIREATPELRLGACGAEAHWSRELARWEEAPGRKPIVARARLEIAQECLEVRPAPELLTTPKDNDPNPDTPDNNHPADDQRQR